MSMARKMSIRRKISNAAARAASAIVNCQLSIAIKRAPAIFLAAAMAMMLAPAQLAAQEWGQVNRLWQPDTVFPASGFAVKDRLQALSIGITAGVVPGPMPVVVQVQIDGSAKSLSRVGTYGELDPDAVGGRLWEAEGQEVFRPIYGTIHLGYSYIESLYGPITENGAIVLEGGEVLDGLRPLQSFTSQPFGLFAAFGLAAAPAGYVMLSSGAQHATWPSSLDGLGSAWKTAINQVLPTGFSASGMHEQQQYRVVVDRHKARAFQYISNFGLYVPVMWRDRAGNTVTFKWERKTSGIPSGATEMVCLTIMNSQGKGAQVQWIVWPDSDTEKDLVRVDFIGINAPSMHIKGYPGVGAGLPAALTAALVPSKPQGIGMIMPIRPKTGGPIMRPTAIVLDGAAGALPALPNGWGLPAHTAGAKSAARRWELTYSSARDQISTYKDPMGLTTTFTYAEGETDCPFGAYYDDGFRRGANGPIKFMRVASATTSTASGGLAHSQSWAWAQGASTVTHTSSFGGVSTATATDYSAAAASDRANGAWKSRKTYDGPSASGSPIATITNNSTAQAGLDGTLTSAPSQAIERMGEPRHTIVSSYGVAGTYNLLPSSVAVMDANDGVAQKTNYTYAPPAWQDLSPGDLLEARATNNGKAAPPQKYEWDGINLSKSFMADAAAGRQWGTEYSYYGAGSAAPGSLESARPYLAEANVATYGAKQAIEYDAATKQPKKVTATDSVSTYTSQITAFDTNLLPAAATDQLGVASATTYDDRGRVVSHKRGGMTTTYTYPTELKVQTSTKPDAGGAALTASQEWDPFGRPTNTVSSAGIATNYTYSGRTMTVRATKGGVAFTQSHTVDALGRPISETGPNGSAVYTYTAAGMPVGQQKVTATRTQGVATITTEETLNLLGQTLQVKEINGPRANTMHTYEYDGMGNITQHKTTSGSTTQTRTFNYDALGRLISRAEPETGTTTFGNYHVSGRPRTMTEQAQAGARTRAISYDGFGRPTEIASGAVDKLQYKYQTDKPLLSQARRVQGSGTVSQDYTYNSYAQLTKEATTGADGFIANVQYQYDAWGDIAKITYPGASSGAAGREVAYGYDSLRQIENIYNGAANIAVLTYDPLGRKQDTVFASGARNTYTHDATRITKWEVSRLGQAAISRPFTYDNYGHLSGTGEWAMTNDMLGRLQTASGLGVSTAHGHDAFGNNISHSVTPNQNKMINWSFAAPLADNRVPATTSPAPNSPTTGWLYSPNGEAVWVGKQVGGSAYLQLGWDGLGLLKSISDNGSSHEFTYAPSGLRVRDKRTGTNAIDKRFVYTTSGALLSVHESPSKRRDIVYANGEAIAEIDQDGNVYELHNDHLGTPRYVTSRTTGKIVGEQAFGPYGEEMRGTFSGGQTLPSGYVPVTGYTGHLNEDLSGLIYMKGRYYSPLWHRFINSDQGVDPRSINQYAYVGGSPFMAKDPSGMAAVMYCTTYYYSTGGTGVEYDPETGLWTETAKINDNSYQDCYTLDWDDWRGGWPGDYGEGGGGIGPGQQENKNNDCDDGGFFDSVANSFRSIGGFFNPSNWNSEGMSRLYDLGPLGQAENISQAAYYATAGSLGVSALAVTGAVGLEVFAPALGRATMGWRGGEVIFWRKTTEGLKKDLRISPFGHRGEPTWQRQLPHWHYRPPSPPGQGTPGKSIDRHLPWEWCKPVK